MRSFYLCGGGRGEGQGWEGEDRLLENGGYGVAGAQIREIRKIRTDVCLMTGMIESRVPCCLCHVLLIQRGPLSPCGYQRSTPRKNHKVLLM